MRILLLSILLAALLPRCESAADCGTQSDPVCNPYLSDFLYLIPEEDRLSLGDTYFGDASADIYRRSLDGQETILVSGLTNLGQIALDLNRGHIFFTDTLTVKRYDVSTGSVTVIANHGADPLGVAVDPATGNVFYTVTGDTNIYRTDAGGSSSSVFAVGTTQPALMAYDRWQDRVYIADISAQTITAYDPDTAQIRYSVNVGEAAFGIAVDHPDFEALYYTTSGAGNLRQVDTATGTVSSLATGLGNVTGIDLDYLARDLYFNDRTNTAAYRQSLRDGTMTQIASGRQFSALKIAFD